MLNITYEIFVSQKNTCDDIINSEKYDDYVFYCTELV